MYCKKSIQLFHLQYSNMSDSDQPFFQEQVLNHSTEGILYIFQPLFLILTYVTLQNCIEELHRRTAATFRITILHWSQGVNFENRVMYVLATTTCNLVLLLVQTVNGGPTIKRKSVQPEAKSTHHPSNQISPPTNQIKPPSNQMEPTSIQIPN